MPANFMGINTLIEKIDKYIFKNGFEVYFYPFKKPSN